MLFRGIEGVMIWVEQLGTTEEMYERIGVAELLSIGSDEKEEFVGERRVYVDDLDRRSYDDWVTGGKDKDRLQCLIQLLRQLCYVLTKVRTLKSKKNGLFEGDLRAIF